MGETSIPCREDTRERLKDLRGDEYQNWDALLNDMADAWEQSPHSIDIDEFVNLLTSANEPDTTLEVQELVDELQKTQELVERVPEDTAEALGERFG